MSAIHFYDDARARRFEPFALTRPAASLVAGVASIADRWITALQLPAAGFVGAAHLADFDESDALHALAGGASLRAGSVVANSRFAPRLHLAPLGLESSARNAGVWRSGGRVAAVRLAVALPVDRLADGTLALEELADGGARVVELDGWWMDEVWDPIQHLAAMLGLDVQALVDGTPAGPPPAHATVLGEYPVAVARDIRAGSQLLRSGATIEPHVVFDASAGPIYVAHEASVHAFTRLVGPCYVGRGSTILGGDVAVASIGDVCKVRGELNTTILAGYANKGHDGFVGHSYLGRWVNLGASTVTSNLKNTYGTVALWTPEGIRDTHLQFLGTLFGDHAKTGIGLRLTTGTVLGAGANVYDRMPPKVVAPFSWGGGAPYAAYRLDKFLDVAERAMSRRHVPLSDRARRQLSAAHAARWTVERVDE